MKIKCLFCLPREEIYTSIFFSRHLNKQINRNYLIFKRYGDIWNLKFFPLYKTMLGAYKYNCIGLFDLGFKIVLLNFNYIIWQKREKNFGKYFGSLYFGTENIVEKQQNKGKN